MLLRKMASNFRAFKQNVNIRKLLINFMRIFLREGVSETITINAEANTEPKWRYVIQYQLGDIYSGNYHEQTGVIAEGNYLRAQAEVKRLICEQYPGATALLITQFERINKPINRRKLKRAQPTGPGFLYLIQGRQGEYKIGLSAIPQQRIMTLGVQLPFPIEVIHLIETENMLAAERLLHDRFDAQRINGEWFALTDTDVDYIKSLTRIDVQ